MPTYRVIHSAARQTHAAYVGLHLLVALGPLPLPSRPPTVLTCLHPVQPPARYQQKGDTEEEAPRQPVLCHLPCGISTHFQNCSSWLLCENGHTPSIRKTYPCIHTPVWGLCASPQYATPQMERGDVWASRGGSLHPGCLPMVEENTHCCSPDSTIKLNSKMGHSKTNKKDWGQGRMGKVYQQPRATLTPGDAWLLGNRQMGKSAPAQPRPRRRRGQSE